MIYADNAATTRLDPDAFQAMLPWLQEEYGNPSAAYAFARKPREAIARARSVLAGCIGAEPEEIYFTSCGTESDNWALKGLFVPGDDRGVITSAIEHHAVLHTCGALARMGCPVLYLPVDGKGTVSPDTLQRAMERDTKVVSVMLVNNEIGTIEPIAKLSKIAHDHGALFHTDAVQALGHIPVDVKDLGVDLLSASAHKFGGPKGVGFLYIKKGTKIAPYQDGGAQERGMRAGTENVAGIVGMAAALQKSCKEMAGTTEKLHEMERDFLDVLKDAGVDFVRNGATNRVPGNLSISIRGKSGESLMHRLDLKGIAVSTGSACDSIVTQVSHVLKAIGLPQEYARGTVRVSFGRENKAEDGKAVAEAIVNILRKS